MKNAIFFVHRSPFPLYLYKAIESARFFNPHTSIYLLCDKIEDIPLKYYGLNIEVLPFHSLETSEHKLFCENYRHISFNDFEYERFCFSRWFYLDAAIKQLGVEHILHLDSDCMLFSSMSRLCSLWKDWDFVVSIAGGPHCTYIRSSLEKLINNINSRFSDSDYLQEKQLLLDEGKRNGKKICLCDMTLINEYVGDNDRAADYNTLKFPGFVDHNINLSQGFQMRGKYKRIYWKAKGDSVIPYFKHISNGRLEQVYAVHYKGGAKRVMKSFNPLNRKLVLPKKASHRAFLFNLIGH